MPKEGKSEGKSEAGKARKGKNTRPKSAESKGTIQIKYYRSFIAAPKTHKQMVRSLGLTKLNQIVERQDNASMRGAVKRIPHLLRIVT